MALRRPLVLTTGARSELPNGDQLPIDALQLPKGYIDGLQMKWVGPNAVTVTSGACYIEGAGKVVANAADMPLTGLALGASSWGHLYAYVSGGVLAIEASSTAPASPYNDTARSKTGNASRRYVGSVRTDASGNIYNFAQQGNKIFWLYDVANSGVARVLSSGIATTMTPISLSNNIPETAISAVISVSNGAPTSGNYFLFTKDANQSNTGGAIGEYVWLAMLPGTSSFVEHPASSQQIYYKYNYAPPSGGFNVDVVGYTFGR